MVALLLGLCTLALGIGAMVPRITEGMASSRDALRVEDLRSLQAAIERYYLENGVYPQPQASAAFGGWDVSHDGEFLPSLVQAGYLQAGLHDPIDDDTFHYRYYVYAPGQYGCDSDQPYYVLGLRAFETPEYASEKRGRIRCARRDWNQEFALVVGSGMRASSDRLSTQLRE